MMLFSIDAVKPKAKVDKVPTAFLVFDVLLVAFIIFLSLKIQSQNFETNNTVTSTSSSTTSIQKLDLTLVEQSLTVPKQYKQGAFTTARKLNLPANFQISVFASGVSSARAFDFDSFGNMYVTERAAGKVVMLADTNEDGVADAIKTIDKGLRNPHGIDYFEGDLYVGEENQVIVYKEINNQGEYKQKKILVPDLPAGAGHATRTVVVGPDNKLYVSIGSSCNVCEEKDSRRAAVLQFDLDGKNQKIIASGLRNSVGLTFAPTGKDGAMELWSVDNGRDSIGDDIPPEEVNVLVEGKNYGWPYCYGSGIVNPEFKGKKEDFCKLTEFPRYEMQAHSAPLGLAFPAGLFGAKTDLPASLNRSLFITFHGSWNRTEPTGYKVVRIDTTSADSEAMDFITGWLEKGQTKPWGRPVGIGFDRKGNMYITDDLAGAVYRVTYNPQATKILSATSSAGSSSSESASSSTNSQ